MALGALLTYHSPETVEMLGAMGFDFITFDLEHEAYNELALVHSIRAAEAFDLTSIVRVPNDPDLILRLLDAGAQGVHVPRVNTREDAQAVVEASRFYPQGKRTFYAVGRSGNYGLGMTEEEYAEASNRETIVVLQVEEEEGVRNIQDIISVPYVDAIQVGPKDLWQSMGMPDRAVVWQVVDRVLAQASEAGLWGSMVAWMDSDIGEQLSRYKGLGVHLVTVSPRELLIHGGRHFLEQAARAGG
jgi:4-hydroxy-2-oxoheptanedioate aldolase